MSRSRHITVTVLGFIAIVIVTSVVVVVGSMYQRANRAEAHAADAEQKLSAAEQRADALEVTEQALSSTRSDLDETTRSLDRTQAENDAFAKRDDACGYLVRVSSEILGTSVAYGKVSNHLMNGRDGHARDVLPQVSKHIDAMDKLIKDAGYKTISELMEACTPTSPSVAQ